MRRSAFPVCPGCAASPAGGASGGPFWCRRAGPLSGAAGGHCGALGQSRQSQTGAVVPYARGILRRQHVMFFHWCEPPVGASLSVSGDSIRLEWGNVFRRRPGASSRPRAVPLSGRRVPAGPSPRRAGSCRLRPLRWRSWVPDPRVLLVLVRACPEVLRVRQLCLALCVNTKLEMTSAMAWTVLRCQCCGLAAGPQHVQAAGTPLLRGVADGGCHQRTIAKLKNPACGVRRCRVRSTSLPS